MLDDTQAVPKALAFWSTNVWSKFSSPGTDCTSHFPLPIDTTVNLSIKKNRVNISHYVLKYFILLNKIKVK